MATAGVGDDGQQGVAEVGIQHRAGGEIDLVLPAQGALRVEAFARVLRAEEQRVDGLIALDIQQAQGLPGLHFEQVRLAGRNQVPEAGGFGMQAAFYDGHVGNLFRCRVVRCCGSPGRSPGAKCGRAR